MDQIKVVQARHRLDALQPARGGTHFVFLSNRHVVKIFRAGYEGDYDSEVAGLPLAHGKLPVATPELVATGEVDGSRYVVLTRLGGEELTGMWPKLDDDARRGLIKQAAELSRALHEIDVPDETDLFDGERYVREQPAHALAKHRQDGVSEDWLADIAQVVPDLPLLEGRAFLHCDIHPEHLLVEAGNLTGLFDFGDAMTGPREYDLAATAVLMAAHVPDGTRTFYEAYGYEGPRDRLAAGLLLQRYCRFPAVLPLIPEALRPADLASLIKLVT